MKYKIGWTKESSSSEQSSYNLLTLAVSIIKIYDFFFNQNKYKEYHIYLGFIVKDEEPLRIMNFFPFWYKTTSIEHS